MKSSTLVHGTRDQRTKPNRVIAIVDGLEKRTDLGSVKKATHATEMIKEMRGQECQTGGEASSRTAATKRCRSKALRTQYMGHK